MTTVAWKAVASVAELAETKDASMAAHSAVSLDAIVGVMMVAWKAAPLVVGLVGYLASP